MCKFIFICACITLIGDYYANTEDYERGYLPKNISERMWNRIEGNIVQEIDSISLLGYTGGKINKILRDEKRKNS